MRIFAALVLLAAALNAAAAVTCTVNVTAINVVYDPTSGVQNVTTGSYSINCTRAGTDPNTFAWQLGVNDGLNFNAGSNRAMRNPAQGYNYDTYRTSPYNAGNLWGDTVGTRFTGTLNFGASLSASTSGPFDIMMPAGQSTGGPASTYNDTVTATLRDGSGTAIGTTSFGVTVVTTNSCQLSVAPTDVSFTYTSFQAGTSSATGSFGVRCTTALPYTLALDATSGTVLGLNYTLALSAASGTGNGATQTYNVNGSMVANQVGTCATGVCTGSQTRTLTLTW
jgi:spore coat protein U-like protein